MHQIHYTRNIINGWNFSFNIMNLNNSVPSELLTDVLKRVNSAFPSANITVASSSDNYIVLDDFEDTWLGLTTSYANLVKIELNNPTLSSDYGAYSSDKTTSAYKKWRGTTVHEFGHTFGFADQASHLPSLYDYGRDRAKASYLQANDLAWLKHAYCDLYDCDESIFETSAASSDIISSANYSIRRTIIDDNEYVIDFDYPYYDSIGEIEHMSTNIVIGTLTFNKTENLNIGSETYPKYMDYNIYTINVISEEKGTLTNKELKIHISEDIIEDGSTYKLYLKEFTKTPCSLINVKEGIIKVS